MIWEFLSLSRCQKVIKLRDYFQKHGIEKKPQVQLYNLLLKPQKNQKVRVFSLTKGSFKR